MTTISPAYLAAVVASPISGVGSNTYHVFVMDASTKVSYWSFYAGTMWSPFTSISGIGMNNIEAVSASPGIIDAFVQGTDTGYAPYVNHYNGRKWSGWSQPATIPQAAAQYGYISACSNFNNDGVIDLFYVGSNGHAYNSRYNGTSWGSYSDLGGNIIANGVGCASSSSSSVMIGATATTDSTIWYKLYSGSTWGSWTLLSGPISGWAPRLVWDGKYYWMLVTEQSTTNVWANYYDGTWHGWSKAITGQGVITPYGAAYTASATTGVLVMGTNGLPYYNQCNISGATPVWGTWSQIESTAINSWGDPARIVPQPGYNSNRLDAFWIDTNSAIVHHSYINGTWSGRDVLPSTVGTSYRMELSSAGTRPYITTLNTSASQNVSAPSNGLYASPSALVESVSQNINIPSKAVYANTPTPTTTGSSLITIASIVANARLVGVTISAGDAISIASISTNADAVANGVPVAVVAAGTFIRLSSLTPFVNAVGGTAPVSVIGIGVTKSLPVNTINPIVTIARASVSNAPIRLSSPRTTAKAQTIVAEAFSHGSRFHEYAIETLVVTTSIDFRSSLPSCSGDAIHSPVPIPATLGYRGLNIITSILWPNNITADPIVAAASLATPTVYVSSGSTSTFQSKVGSFIAPAIVGTQTVTTGFQPAAVIFFVAGGSATGWTNDCINGVGFITANGSGAVGEYSLNGKSGAGGTQEYSKHAVAAIAIPSSTGGAYLDATLSSLTATGFTINWINTVNGAIINYLAIGGSSVTNAMVKQWQTSTVATDSITGVGFQPDLLINISIDSSLPPQTVAADHSTISMGAFSKAGTQWATSTWANAGAAPFTNVYTVQEVSDRMQVFPMMDMNNHTIGVNGSTSDADGFSVSYNKAGMGPYNISTLCLKGGTYNVGQWSKATSGNTDIVPISKGPPSAVFLASNAQVSGASIVTTGRMMLGASDGINNHVTTLTNANNLSVSECYKYTDATNSIYIVNNDTKTLNAAGTVGNFVANQFSVSYSTNSGNAATQICYITFGA
jgi:hypothetical protein